MMAQCLSTAGEPRSEIPHVLVLWLNANFGTGFRKQKFGEKPGTFDL